MISTEKEYLELLEKHKKEERKYAKKVKRDINKILLWARLKKWLLGRK